MSALAAPIASSTLSIRAPFAGLAAIVCAAVAGCVADLRPQHAGVDTVDQVPQPLGSTREPGVDVYATYAWHTVGVPTYGDDARAPVLRVPLCQ
jgi:hypothetical protein